MNVPKIRFKGFECEWGKTTFADLLAFERPDEYIVKSTEYSDFYKTPVLTANKGFILGYTNETRTYNQECIIFDDFTLDSKYVDFPFMVKSSAMKILTLKDKEHSNLFFVHSLLSHANIEILGHARHYISVVQPTNVRIPATFAEQQQIAEYFKNLDSLIEATGKKVASLKQTKQACLQSMFPQPGETTPRIRFKGFEGDWEKKQIGDISTSSKGNGYSKADLRLEGTPIVLYGRMYTKYSFEMDNIDTFATPKDGAVYSKGNEVVIPASGETAEDIAIAAAIKQSGVILGGDLNILTFNDDYLPSFMALCISNSETHYELSKFAQGKSVVHLRNNDIAKGTVTCPSLVEQQQIASFFSNLDKQIALQEQRLEKLKQIKAACLDNMFV